jgi:hypothetical protein
MTIRILRSTGVWIVPVMVLAAVARPAAQAPGLGDLARKEAERRKAQPSASKVYTNKDLPPSAAAPRPEAAADSPYGADAKPEDAAAAEADQKPAPDEKPADEVRNEAWWKGRLVRRNQMFADALQTKVNALSSDFVSRDNPVQRAQIGQERAEALEELARVKQEILRGTQQIADIEEEARKEGVPPGWLR